MIPHIYGHLPFGGKVDPIDRSFGDVAVGDGLDAMPGTTATGRVTIRRLTGGLVRE
jgi:hypothetical protein